MIPAIDPFLRKIQNVITNGLANWQSKKIEEILFDTYKKGFEAGLNYGVFFSDIDNLGLDLKKLNDN